MYNFREMRLLERVDFCGKSVGGVGRGDRTTELGNRRSRIDTFRHIVDGDPLSASPAAMTARCTFIPHIPLPPNFGSSDGCTLTIRSGKASSTSFGTTVRNPASTTRSTAASRITATAFCGLSRHSARGTITAGTPYGFSLSITGASRSAISNATSATSEF